MCQARQYSDQMQCDRCGLVWDMNDEDRPECLTVDELWAELIKAMLADLENSG